MRLSHSIIALLMAASASAVTPSAIQKAESFGIMDNPAGVLDALALDRPDGADETLVWTEARALYHNGQYAAAAIAMSRFTEDFPNSLQCAAALAVRAECLMAQGDTVSALDCLRQVSTAGMNADAASAVHYATGICLIETGDTGAGVDELKKAVSGPAAVRAAYVRACMAVNRGKAEEARQLLPSGTSVLPHGLLDASGARIDFLTERYAQALDKGRRALESGHLDAAQTLEIKRIVGLSLIKTGARAESVRMLRDYLAEGGDDAAAQLAVGENDYSEGRYADASTLLARAATAPGSTGQYASLYLGEALEALGRNDEAILAYNAASQPAGSDAARTAAFNAAVLSARGNGLPFKSAAALFEDFLSQYPEGLYTDRVREYLALGYLSENDYTRALERIEAVRMQTPAVLQAHKQILFRLGLQQIDAGDGASARAALERAGSIQTPGTAALDADIILAQGRAAQLEGNNAEAVALYDRYLRTAPRGSANIARAHYFKGYARYAQRLYADADREFEAAQESGAFSGAELADILNRRGDISYYASVFGPARDFYRRAHAADCSGGDYALFQQARMEGYERDYSAKLNSLASFLNSYPSSPLVAEAMMEKTQALISLGRNNEAVEVFTDISRKYPRTSQGRRALLQKGLTLADASRTGEAAATYRSLISTYPSSAEARQASLLLRRIYADEGRGNEYLAFMQSVEGAPEVDREDASQLLFDSARRSFAGDGGAAMVNFLNTYPDSPQAEEALAMLARHDFESGRVPEALARWKTLAASASDVATATRARMGIIRSARQLGLNAEAGAAAQAVLESSAGQIAASEIAEAAYSAGVYARENGDADGAVALWDHVSDNTNDLYGIRCAYAAAESRFAEGNHADALQRTHKITSSRSPHKYWVARAFILQADILAAQGKKYEARQYLEALRNNYPGNEADIRDMTDQRLSNLSE